MENSATSVICCECEIVRIVYRQALTGFTVCEVRQVQPLVSPVMPLVFKAVCVSPAELLVGARCDLEGEWEAGKYGMQLKVSRLSPVRAPSLEGTLQYLQSRLVYGIGPGLAKRIVTRFGLDTLRILESDPERLLEVPGIGRQTVDPVRGKPRSSGRGRIARTPPPPTLALAFPKTG